MSYNYKVGDRFRNTHTGVICTITDYNPDIDKYEISWENSETDMRHVSWHDKQNIDLFVRMGDVTYLSKPILDDNLFEL